MASPALDPNFSQLLSTFERHGVRYLLLGGYAVILHGYDRTTNDLDLWIAVDPANARRVSAALVEFGFPASAVAAELFERPGHVFRFGRPPVRIELLTSPSGVDFEACWRGRVVHDLGGVSVPVIGLADLRRNKAASGRAKDMADLEELPQPPAGDDDARALPGR